MRLRGIPLDAWTHLSHPISIKWAKHGIGVDHCRKSQGNTWLHEERWILLNVIAGQSRSNKPRLPRLNAHDSSWLWLTVATRGALWSVWSPSDAQRKELSSASNLHHNAIFIGRRKDQDPIATRSWPDHCAIGAMIKRDHSFLAVKSRPWSRRDQGHDSWD